MALFELEQEFLGGAEDEHELSFKEAVEEDIDAAFFEADEHAEWHTVNGKKCLIVLEEDILKPYSAHWEAGAKQNFDTGLYTALSILYIKKVDYGRRPKIGVLLTIDQGTKQERLFFIKHFGSESGVYRIELERTRQ